LDRHRRLYGCVTGRTDAHPHVMTDPGEPLWFLGTLARIKLDGDETGGRLPPVEIPLPPRSAPPLPPPPHHAPLPLPPPPPAPEPPPTASRPSNNNSASSATAPHPHPPNGQLEAGDEDAIAEQVAVNGGALKVDVTALGDRRPATAGRATAEASGLWSALVVP